MEYDDTHYLYRKNLFGDITAIYDRDTCVAKYAYDAYGVCKVLNPDGTENTDSSFIGNINPIRYRGYYYDVATGFYYLQTRYYDPQTGRFLNMDSLEYLDPETVGGLNLYAYCNCNPVMYVDPEGTAWGNWVIGAIAAVAVAALTIVTCGAAVGIAAVATGAIVGGAYGAANAAANGDNVIEGMFTGMISGVIAGGTAAIGTCVITSTLAANCFLAALGGNALVGFGISIVGGIAAGTFSEINNQLNESGEITNAGAIIHSAAVSAGANVLSTLIGMPTAKETSISIVAVGSYIYNVITGSISLVIDSLRK